jgi:glycerophosphoryl diester phosphodiesterase
LDVHLTADQSLVVIHDAGVKRTTGEVGNIRRMRLDDIQKLDAGGYFAPEYLGERIPTLDVVLEEIGGRVLLDIELKDFYNPFSKVPELTAAAVLRHHLEEQVLFSSFNPSFLYKVKKIIPSALVGLLVLPGWYGRFEKIGLIRKTIWDAVIIHYSDVLHSRVSIDQSMGKMVLAYTVETGEQVTSLLSAGIDGIITNDPTLVFRTRRMDDSRRMARPSRRAVSG